MVRRSCTRCDGRCVGTNEDRAQIRGYQVRFSRVGQVVSGAPVLAWGAGAPITLPVGLDGPGWRARIGEFPRLGADGHTVGSLRLKQSRCQRPSVLALVLWSWRALELRRAAWDITETLAYPRLTALYGEQALYHDLQVVLVVLNACRPRLPHEAHSCRAVLSDSTFS